MKREKYKIIVSQNFNAVHPVNREITYSEKIELFSEYLKAKYTDLSKVPIICAQEVLAGSNGKYLKQLSAAFDDEYDIVMPPGFNVLKHPRSLLTVTMVRKDLEYRVVKIDSCLPNRICCAEVRFEDNTVLHILNLHAVQTAYFHPAAAPWYITRRVELKEELWKTVLSKAKECEEPLLICGDLQEGSTGPHMKKLIELGFREKNGGFPTAKNPIFEERSIDHFLYNPAAWETFYPVSFEYDGNLLGELSDHILLAAVSE